MLCGNSLGGYLAMRYASERPERVRALVVHSPGGGPLPRPHRELLLDRFRLHDHRRALELVDRSRRPGAEGPNVLVTYSLVTEAGHTYRALREKGLRPVEIVPGTGGGGSRASDDASQKGVDRLRWEYGPGARAADWALLDKVGQGVLE